MKDTERVVLRTPHLAQPAIDDVSYRLPPSHCMVFRPPAGLSHAEALARLQACQQELADAGYHLLAGWQAGEHCLRGEQASRWWLIQFMDERGFALDRIYSLS